MAIDLSNINNYVIPVIPVITAYKSDMKYVVVNNNSRKSENYYVITHHIADYLLYLSEGESLLKDIVNNILYKFEKDVGINLNPESLISITIIAGKLVHRADTEIKFRFEIPEPVKPITNSNTLFGFNFNENPWLSYTIKNFDEGPITFKGLSEYLKNE